MGNAQPGKKSCIRLVLDKIFQTEFTKLVTAIRTGNISLVKKFYQQKVNFLQYLQNGDTPFHIAVKFNNFEIVKFIAENIQNLNLNDQNFLGDTPLLIAIMNGNKDIFNYLLSREVIDLNIAENKGYTPFIAACASGELDFVDKLCKRGCNIRLKTRDGQTAVHRAAFYGHQKVLIYLIKKLKMNVMIPDRKGNLPLHYACMKLNMSCIRILIKITDFTVNDLLYTPNKYGVKPVDIILKVLGRIRAHDDPHTNAEQIEEYLSDKYNLPPFKKAISPTQTLNRSITGRSIIFQNQQRDSVKTITSQQVIRLQSVNERAEILTESDLASPTIIEEKITENEEEQFIKRHRSRLASSQSEIPSGISPTIIFKKISIPQNDSSPIKSPEKAFTMIAPRLLMLKKEQTLKVDTILHDNPKVMRAKTHAKNNAPTETATGSLGSGKNVFFLPSPSPSNKSKFS